MQQTRKKATGSRKKVAHTRTAATARSGTRSRRPKPSPTDRARQTAKRRANALSIAVIANDVEFDSPILLASGPKGETADQFGTAIGAGFGSVVWKTLSAKGTPNVARRHQPWEMKSGRKTILLGWQNIEVIYDKSLKKGLAAIRKARRQNPYAKIVVSVMAPPNKKAWVTLIRLCVEAGADVIELNMGCPHGLPERGMGSAMGQDPKILYRVCRWARSATTVPIWCKLTPNVTSIIECARAALKAGCDGISLINTIGCVMGVDLDTLKPRPTNSGKSTKGGYSGMGVFPIALRMVLEVAQLIRDEFPDQGKTISAMGGVTSWREVVQFILHGADTVQVLTHIMKYGYDEVKTMNNGLKRWMKRHGFKTIEEFRGLVINDYVSHTELLRLLRKERRAKKTG